MTLTRRMLVAAALLGLAVRPAAAAEMPTVLITGSSRGIGLEFAKQYAARGWHVIATARNLEESATLVQLAAAHKNVELERLDITDAHAVDALAHKLAGRSIDLLVNNAGLTPSPEDLRGQHFGTLDYGQLNTYLNVDAIGAIKVTEAFYPLIKASSQKKIVTITSLVALHGVNYNGMEGGYWYKIAKGALNVAMANIANDVRKDGVIVLLMSPGTVHVEKNGDVHYPGEIMPSESIAGMIKVIDGLTLSDSGTIRRYSGEQLPF